MDTHVGSTLCQNSHPDQIQGLGSRYVEDWVLPLNAGALPTQRPAF